MAAQERSLKNREEKYLDGCGENEKKGKKVWKKKKEIETMQRGDGSFRRAYIHLNTLVGRDLGITS